MQKSWKCRICGIKIKVSTINHDDYITHMRTHIVAERQPLDISNEPLWLQMELNKVREAEPKVISERIITDGANAAEYVTPAYDETPVEPVTERFIMKNVHAPGRPVKDGNELDVKDRQALQQKIREAGCKTRKEYIQKMIGAKRR